MKERRKETERTLNKGKKKANGSKEKKQRSNGRNEKGKKEKE